MATPASFSTSDAKIIINFGWEGKTRRYGGLSRGGLEIRVVDLVFNGGKIDISVDIPQNLPPSFRKLPFTCRRYLETERVIRGRSVRMIDKETYPDLLKVSLKKFITEGELTLKAGIFEPSPQQGPTIIDESGKFVRENRVIRSDREIKLEIPENLEADQIYTLFVKSTKFTFSACLVKDIHAKASMQAQESPNEDYIERMKKMSEALISEGLKNLSLAANGGVGVFNSSSTRADIYAHGIRGVIQSAQQLHPRLVIPKNEPSFSSSALDTMSEEELKKRFEITFQKDREFEDQRLMMSVTGDLDGMNRVLEAELANSKFLIMLAEALERKGVSAQIPE